MSAESAVADLMAATYRSLLVAEEHDAREDALYAAVMRIVGRIAGRVRGLCCSLEHRLARGRRGR